MITRWSQLRSEAEKFYVVCLLSTYQQYLTKYPCYPDLRGITCGMLCTVMALDWTSLKCHHSHATLRGVSILISYLAGLWVLEKRYLRKQRQRTDARERKLTWSLSSQQKLPLGSKSFLPPPPQQSVPGSKIVRMWKPSRSWEGVKHPLLPPASLRHRRPLKRRETSDRLNN